MKVTIPILLLASALIAAEPEGSLTQFPPPISAEDQVRVLKLAREYDQAQAAQTAAFQNMQSAVARYNTLLNELRETYECKDCTINLATVTFIAPLRESEEVVETNEEETTPDE